MNRRAFFKTAAVLAGATLLRVKVSAAEITPPITAFKKMGDAAVLNPEWVNAPYEIGFYHTGWTYPTRDPWPLRFRNAESAQYYISKIRS